MKKLSDFLVDNFIKYQTNMRIAMIGNSLVVLFIGAGIGTSCAFWVLLMNDILKSPWSYLCAITTPFIIKTIVMWLGTLVLAPFIRDISSRAFKAQTGRSVPEYGVLPLDITGNLVTIPVAATIAVTIYLSGPMPPGVIPTNDELIYYIAITVGVVVSLAENLCNPTIIKAIWHNRADYQESPLFQQSMNKMSNDSTQATTESRVNSNRPKSQRKKSKSKSRRRNR